MWTRVRVSVERTSAVESLTAEDPKNISHAFDSYGGFGGGWATSVAGQSINAKQPESLEAARKVTQVKD
jgi:hypothetical protein